MGSYYFSPLFNKNKYLHKIWKMFPWTTPEDELTLHLTEVGEHTNIFIICMHYRFSKPGYN